MSIEYVPQGRACSTCREHKPFSAFATKSHVRGRKSAALRSVCRECHARTAARNARSKTVFVVQHKIDTGCQDCGRTWPDYPSILEFDHREGEVKLFDLGKANCHGWEAIHAEIAKCDVVCANCHRIRTADRAASKRSARAVA